jgi:hypothetical protein
MKPIKNEIVKSMKFVISLLVIYFIFFGVIANTFQKTPGDYVLFVYLNFIHPQTWYTLIILSAIFMFHAMLEDFLIYAIKYTLLFVPCIVIISLIWYDINYRVFLDGIITYFTSIEGYINILVLYVLAFLMALVGGYLKSLYIQSNRKKLSLVKK